AGLFSGGRYWVRTSTTTPLLSFLVRAIYAYFQSLFATRPSGQPGMQLDTSTNVLDTYWTRERLTPWGGNDRSGRSRSCQVAGSGLVTPTLKVGSPPVENP